MPAGGGAGRAHIDRVGESDTGSKSGTEGKEVLFKQKNGLI